MNNTLGYGEYTISEQQNYHKHCRHLLSPINILPTIPYMYQWTNSGNITWNISWKYIVVEKSHPCPKCDIDNLLVFFPFQGKPPTRVKTLKSQGKKQKFASKNLQAKICKKKFASKNLQAKNLQAKTCKQTLASKDLQAKICK